MCVAWRIITHRASWRSCVCLSACSSARVTVRSFKTISKNGSKALVLSQWAESIAAALLDRAGCVSVSAGGRGNLLRFRYEDGHGLIRPCLRGGLVRHFVKDSYLLRNRPLRELHLHEQLFEKGLSVPEPLGASWQRRGLCFRGALATKEVDAADLLAYLVDPPEQVGPALRRCGKLIRRMHDLGVFHADLQVRNILVGKDKEYLIDFDNARLVRRLSTLQRARNLLRLRRSFEKNQVPPAHFEQLLEGYGMQALPKWLETSYHVKGILADKLSGRS